MGWGGWLLREVTFEASKGQRGKPETPSSTAAKKQNPPSQNTPPQRWKVNNTWRPRKWGERIRVGRYALKMEYGSTKVAKNWFWGNGSKGD